MRSRTSRSSVARTASLTRSPGLGPTASSRVGSAAIAINSMALIPSPRTASWLTRTRSGAGRATMVPRTSYAAGRRTVPQMPAANADSRAMKSSATRTRRLIRLGALAGAEDPVGPPEILGRQDPLARAPFLEEGHGALVAGAERGEQQSAADDHPQDAGDGLSRDVHDIQGGGTHRVPRRPLGGLLARDRLLHDLRLSGGRRRRHLRGLGLCGGLWCRLRRGLCGLLGGLHGWRRRLRRLLGVWRRLLGGRLRRLLRAGKRRERTRAEQRHHDRERDRPSREPHRMTSLVAGEPSHLETPSIA